MKYKLIIKEKQQKLNVEPINLLISLSLLPLLIILTHNIIEFKNLLTPIQNVAENFFVRCNAGFDCPNVLMPFLGYILHAYDSSEKMLGLWAICSIVPTVYLAYEILKSKIKIIHKIIVIVIWAITAWGVVHGAVGAELIPCINFLLISLLKIVGDQYGWESFALAALLFNLGLGVLFFVILILVLLTQSISKTARLMIIKIVRQLCVASAIILIYLSMIDYNFL